SASFACNSCSPAMRVQACVCDLHCERCAGVGKLGQGGKCCDLKTQESRDERTPKRSNALQHTRAAGTHSMRAGNNLAEQNKEQTGQAERANGSWFAWHFVHCVASAERVHASQQSTRMQSESQRGCC